MKNTGIILLTGLGMLAVGTAFGRITDIMMPSVKAEYMDPALFRPWSDPEMSLFWLVPFISAGMMFLVWNLTKRQIKGSTRSAKGFNFALIYWMISIPGMIMSYSSFQLSGAIVLSWSISGLLENVLAGQIYARWRS